MKVAIFDAHAYDRQTFDLENQNHHHELVYFDVRLNQSSAKLAQDFPVVCSFVNDKLDRETLQQLALGATKLIALRSAGFNHVDLKMAAMLGIKVSRVPEYSPHAVAEHAVALLMTLNRKIHRAHARIHELNFSLEGLVGFDLYKKTVGVIGTGRIGEAFARIMLGFGCEVLAYDRQANADLVSSKVRYVSLDELLRGSDVISLHLPLNESTKYLIDESAIQKMKTGVYLINTGRGALIETKALIQALKSKKLGGAGLDVYEEEEGVFFEDLSDQGITDDLLARLLTFPNVLITSHQAFLTREALAQIAKVTLESVTKFERGLTLTNEV